MVGRGPVERRGDAVELFLKVTPGARREAIGAVISDGDGARRLHVTVRAPAEGGEANRAIVRLLAKSWRIAPSSLALVGGRSSCLKRLRLEVSADKAEALERLLG